ncbi:MAG: hypothetical protein KDI55_22440 [Anaerolineae bacterium]|nr:hypothetical protein [Anaerolineae bacterium]
MWFSKQMTAAVLGLACAHSALACGYHGAIGNYLAVMHPDSLVVAVALRQAAEAGTVDYSDLAVATRRPGMYLDVVRRLHQFRSAFTSVAADEDRGLVFSVGLVESGLWTRYDVSGGEAEADIHSEGPREGEAVVLTGDAALKGILSGTLKVDHALATGLVLIEGPEHEQTRIRRALTRLPAQPGIAVAQQPVATTSASGAGREIK